MLEIVTRHFFHQGRFEVDAAVGFFRQRRVRRHRRREVHLLLGRNSGLLLRA